MEDLPHVPGVEHDLVDAGGLRLHVASAGPADGPVVVLLHGWPQHWWLWRHQIPALAAEGHRVLAIDLRGHGWSDAPAHGYDKEQFATDVLAALDTLGAGRFAVAGHDWGGFTAQLLALRAPERVTRVAALNIVPVLPQLAVTLPRFYRSAYQLPLVTPGLGPWVQQRLLGRFLLGVDKEAQAVYAARFRDPARARAGTQVYRDFWRRDVAATARRRGRLDQPFLVVHGMKDPVVRPAMLRGFRDLASDLRVEELPDAGHFVVDQRPEKVTELLAAHFRT